MIQTITTDVQLVAMFRAVDEAGDAVSVTNSQGTMDALTPLAAMELLEKLHAGRNKVRRDAGLPEIATPDEGVLVLAFLRTLREEPAVMFREVLDRWDEAAKQVQMNRAEEAIAREWRHPLTEVDPKAAFPCDANGQGPLPEKPWPCPSCHVPNTSLAWKGGVGDRAEADCSACGATHTYQGWLHAAGCEQTAETAGR